MGIPLGIDARKTLEKFPQKTLEHQIFLKSVKTSKTYTLVAKVKGLAFLGYQTVDPDTDLLFQIFT
jgi:hypothetical protein